MFHTVLIANRGEIACRVIRTCRRLGVRTVAVFSEADEHALHVELADEAHLIGPASAQQSYLRVDAILDVARRSGAEAIHPGYGFLSEQPTFARSAASAGIVFIGPSPEAMEAVGDKLPARAAAKAAGFPIVPGTDGAISLDSVDEEARRLGFPLLMKASAGGGGIGITRVDGPEQIEGALQQTSGLAERFFGSPTIYLERLVPSARHVEVQMVSDMHGNYLTLGTRDCSVQRRHQKVIEEATAFSLGEAEANLLNDAQRLARSIGYTNAGTIECLFGEGQYYFLEVNARLQVEHPPTEEVFGVDLVEEQLRVAAGEPLSARALGARADGHAIECRIYAEDPATKRPTPGVIDQLSFPSHEAVRIDTGYRSGDAVTPFYDPMIAKLTVWGTDRRDALARLESALDESEVTGLTTNLPLLRRIVRFPEFSEGSYDTGVLSRLG